MHNCPSTGGESLPLRRPIGFLDIPLEIRLQIYRHCLVGRVPVQLRGIFVDPYRFSEWGIRDHKKSLLLVSRKVGLEALEILYGDNVFLVHLHEDGGYSLKEHFSEANIRRIRRMQLVMGPQGCFYGRTLDPTLWSPVLAQITKLSVVAQQPLQATIYHVPSFEHEMKEWVVWLRKILQYFARQLPSSCIVEVDDDDRRETSSLMKDYLPRGYRKVQTLEGDLCFRRNVFSKESGYWDNDFDDHDVDSNASRLRLLMADAMTPRNRSDHSRIPDMKE